MPDHVPEDQRKQPPENFMRPEKPSEAVQDAFKTFVNSTHPEPVQVVPEKLFESTSLSDSSIRRSYFRTEDDGNVGYSFIERASARFELESFGEFMITDDHSRVRLDHRKTTEDQLATIIDFNGDGRDLSINYNGNGDFRNLTFSSTRPAHFSYYIRLSDLKEIEGRKFLEREVDGFIFRVDFQGNRMILTRSRGQDVLDMVSFPETIDWESVAKKLFYPETLADPANADTALDESWKDPEKVKKALGIEWQIDLITPKPEPKPEPDF